MALGYFEKERIAMYVVTVFTVLGILIGFVAGFTDYWMILTIPDSTYRNATRAWVTGYHSGLWRICRFEVINSTVPEIHREYSHPLGFNAFPAKKKLCVFVPFSSLTRTLTESLIFVNDTRFSVLCSWNGERMAQFTSVPRKQKRIKCLCFCRICVVQEDFLIHPINLKSSASVAAVMLARLIEQLHVL